MKLHPKRQPLPILAIIKNLRRYAVLGFFLLVMAVYGFMLYRINGLSSAQPTPDAVTQQLKTAAQPHIDKSVISQLDQLQDNSVNVQALFNQARSNPFQ